MNIATSARIVIKDWMNSQVNRAIDWYWTRVNKPDEPLRYTINRMLVGGVIANILGTVVALIFVARRAVRSLRD